MGGGSSSKKSSSRARTRGRVRQHEFVEKVITYEDHAITSGFGYDLLARSGWVEGQALGVRRGGDAENTGLKPIPIVVRTTRAGIGSPTLSTASSVDDNSPTNEHIDNDDDNSLVFDPLRPRCRYNPAHVCASLKALQKHERNCPANRGRHHEEGVPFPDNLLTDDSEE